MIAYGQVGGARHEPNAPAPRAEIPDAVAITLCAPKPKPVPKPERWSGRVPGGVNDRKARRVAERQAARDAGEYEAQRIERADHAALVAAFGHADTWANIADHAWRLSETAPRGAEVGPVMRRLSTAAADLARLITEATNQPAGAGTDTTPGASDR